MRAQRGRSAAIKRLACCSATTFNPSPTFARQCRCARLAFKSNNTKIGWLPRGRRKRFSKKPRLPSKPGSMHYEKAPPLQKVAAGVGAASASLRCAGLRSATAALESNCSSVPGGKGLQESLVKLAGEWHFTLRER